MEQHFILMFQEQLLRWRYQIVHPHSSLPVVVISEPDCVPVNGTVTYMWMRAIDYRRNPVSSPHQTDQHSANTAIQLFSMNSCASYPSQWPGKCRSTSSRWTRWWPASCAGRCPPPAANSCWPSHCTASSPWHHGTTSQPDRWHRGGGGEDTNKKPRLLGYFSEVTKQVEKRCFKSEVCSGLGCIPLQLSRINSASHLSTIQCSNWLTTAVQRSRIAALHKSHFSFLFILLHSNWSYNMILNTIPMSLVLWHKSNESHLQYIWSFTAIDADTMSFWRDIM